jgi:hypothetical protein
MTTHGVPPVDAAPNRDPYHRHAESSPEAAHAQAEGQRARIVAAPLSSAPSSKRMSPCTPCGCGRRLLTAPTRGPSTIRCCACRTPSRLALAEIAAWLRKRWAHVVPSVGEVASGGACCGAALGYS